MKKHEFLLPLGSLFAPPDAETYDPILFQSPESCGDEDFPVLTAPASWSEEAVATMADAAATVPADLYAIEENTVPSWLWQHQSRGSRQEQESDLRVIFDRAVGSAAAKAWKLSLFANEKQARIFFDELRLGLMQRHIAIAPQVMADWGLNWAYGYDASHSYTAPQSINPTRIPNAAIDGLIGKNKNADAGSLKQLFTTRGKEISTVSLQLSDIAADWYSSRPNPAQAVIDLLAMRHNDGSINIEALKQTVRLLVLLLDLHDRHDITIGFANLAPLLLALGLAYDSDAGRAMAASLAALVTAESYATSAELASLRGMSDEFTENREAVMRSLRNHRRAVYGDDNDYEKLSVLPKSLPLKNCPDLALVAEAQRLWDHALESARAFGLRATQVTDLTASPVFTLLMSTGAQGLAPMQSLSILQPDAYDMPRAVIHPAIGEAMIRLGYTREAINATVRHIVGARTLHKAPVINHASLRAKGLSDTAIEKIESYLPLVNSVRLTVTPWIIGVDFCKTQLKIASRTLDAPRFDLLKHLGFSDADIAAANIHCYGHGTARNAKSLHLRQRQLFACGSEISQDARLRMASSVQSFVSGDVGFVAHLPASDSIAHGIDTTLAVWKVGIKSLTLIFDPALAVPKHAVASSRKIKAKTHMQVKAAVSPRRSVKKQTPVLTTKKPSSLRHKTR